MSDTVRYDDRTPRLFFLAAVVWAVVGMLVGVLIAAMLFVPALNLAPFLTFGRLRPLHTNAVIFAFVGNMIFAGIYYSTQRLLKVRMASDRLALLPLADDDRPLEDADGSPPEPAADMKEGLTP